MRLPLVDCSLEALGSIPSTTETQLRGACCGLSTSEVRLEDQKDQGHPQIDIELKASLRFSKTLL